MSSPELLPGTIYASSTANGMGLTRLSREELRLRWQNLVDGISAQLNTPDSLETSPNPLAARAQIPLITQAAWDKVPSGASAVVASIAGTNWDMRLFSKDEEGGATLAQGQTISYPVAQRSVSLSTFVDRIAAPIAEAVRRAPEKISGVGISLGFPHQNSTTPNGIDAELMATADGQLPKRWIITDWRDLSQRERNIGAAILRALRRRACNIENLSIINDTVAVALDSGAAHAATKAGLGVVPAGVVGGTGTNAAINQNGLVNLEIGHAPWPHDPVNERMTRQGWIVGDPELEHETGMYLPYRLAAGMQLLDEQGLFPGGTAAARNLLEEAPRNATLISDLAAGHLSSQGPTQTLAQEVLHRAGQVYGTMLAAVTEVADGRRPEANRPRMAMLTEGSVLLKGRGIRSAAEEAAADLGQPISVWEASGLKGAGALALSWPHLAH